MKKNYNPPTDVRNENVEVSRRIYRAIVDLARNLDESRDRAQSCAELFVPNVEAQRVKLRDLCEKLIFTDPVGHGRKGEELLWRKGYYDVVAAAKRLRKVLERIHKDEVCEPVVHSPRGMCLGTLCGSHSSALALNIYRQNNTWHENEAASVQSHLSAGVGHYHHLILRLQIECKLDLRGIVDFPFLVNDGGLVKGKTKSRANDGAEEWVQQTLHRCLVYLGDLGRYFLEIQPQWDTGLPHRYYLQAISLNADIGMPHNQLGTLSGAQNYSVDAAYHYMRCICCAQSFEGAEGNLRRILEKSSQWLEHQTSWKIDDKEHEMVPAERIHCFVARFLVLVDVWFFDRTFPANPHQLCQRVIEDFKHCLRYAKRFPSDTHLSPEQMNLEDLLNMDNDQESEKPEYLKDEVIFELVVMLLLCVSRLKTKRSKLFFSLVNFALAVLSELVQLVVEHIQDSVLSIPHPVTPDDFVQPSEGPSQEDPRPPSTSEESSVLQTNNSSPALTPLENDVGDTGSKKVSETNGTLLIDVKKKSEGEKVKKKKKKKMKYLNKFRRRRPKALSHNSSEDSDYSDAEIPYGSSFSSDEGNEDISETDEHLNSSSDDDDDDDDDEEEDDSDVSSSSRREESKESITEEKTVKEEEEGVAVEPKANGSVNGSSEEVVGKGALVSAVEEKAMQNGVLEESAPPAVGNSGPANKADGVEVHGPADPADLVELATAEGLLPVIKICTDWLLSEKETLRRCVNCNPLLLSRLVSLLNLINVDTAKLEKCKEHTKIFKLKNIQDVFRKVPLTEDIKLKGVSLLKEAHDALDWEFPRKNCLHSKEEALLRVFKLVEFGKFVASIDDGRIINYNEPQRAFATSFGVEEEQTLINGPQGGGGGREQGGGGGREQGGGGGREQGGGGGGRGRGREEVMAHMGTLWLRAQVHELETRVQLQQRRRPAATLSPYVAVDSEALTAHLALVKQLVAARRFIVLIPAVVVSALDELKREVSRAREAIRWLEVQFQRGNRFLRAQRLHERLPLPLIKYPKKKERDAWAFFQVVECCYYFSKQNGVHDLGPDTPLVTLLTGHRLPPDDSYSPLGVAATAGVNLEHIEAFYAKWKTTSKSHG